MSAEKAIKVLFALFAKEKWKTEVIIRELAAILVRNVKIKLLFGSKL